MLACWNSSAPAIPRGCESTKVDYYIPLEQTQRELQDGVKVNREGWRGGGRSEKIIFLHRAEILLEHTLPSSSCADMWATHAPVIICHIICVFIFLFAYLYLCFFYSFFFLLQILSTYCAYLVKFSFYIVHFAYVDSLSSQTVYLIFIASSCALYHLSNYAALVLVVLVFSKMTSNFELLGLDENQWHSRIQQKKLSNSIIKMQKSKKTAHVLLKLVQKSTDFQPLFRKIGQTLNKTVNCIGKSKLFSLQHR